MNWQTKLSTWAKRLKKISEDGLARASTIYETDNYRIFGRVADQLDDNAAEETVAFSPLGHPVQTKLSPAAVADGAVIDEHGQILLIRRADNNLWAMPGGALEVGETVAAGAVREVYEETGVTSQAVGLVGVWDSRLYEGVHSRFHMYQFVMLCQPLAGATISENPSHALEIKEVRWFAENQLPSQEEIDPGHRPRLPYVFAAWRGEERPFFNPLTKAE